MLKFGKVKERDLAKARVKVEFEEADGFVSGWIAVPQTRTKTDKFYSMPDIEEQVSCLMDERCEEGVLIGSHYDDTNKPSGDYAADGKSSLDLGGGKIILILDRTTPAVNLVMNNGGIALASKTDGSIKVLIDTSGTHVQGDLFVFGNVDIQGNLTVSGNISANGISASGDIAGQGNINAQGNVRAHGEIEAGPTGTSVKLRTHTHPTAPVGPVSPPTPGT